VLVEMPSAWRVRRDCRGEGLGPLVQRSATHSAGGPGVATYYYRRRGGKKHRVWATVHCFPSRPFGGDAAGIRPAARSDIPTCVALINAAHRGQDLFRPYDEAYLESKLDDRPWPAGSTAAVHGWPDFYALEEQGRIVSCAGLWDRGRDMREVWEHPSTGERRIVTATALLDFGFAAGREDAMARLVGYLMGVSHDLGRGHLMASLDFLPSLVERLQAYEPAAEKRALYWHAGPALRDLGATGLHRPYTDLAYW
jgi:hypothetical protein